MGWLPTSILPGEALFAYVASALRLAEIYVPFVDVSEAGWRKCGSCGGGAGRSTQRGCRHGDVSRHERSRPWAPQSFPLSPRPDTVVDLFKPLRPAAKKSSPAQHERLFRACLRADPVRQSHCRGSVVPTT